jgi:hypothetical protein
MEWVHEAGISKKRAHSMKSAADQIGVSVFTLWAHKKAGSIRTIQVGRRVLVPEQELQRIAAVGLPSLSQAREQGRLQKLARQDRVGNLATATAEQDREVEQ